MQRRTANSGSLPTTSEQEQQQQQQQKKISTTTTTPGRNSKLKNDVQRRKKRRRAVLSAFAQFRYELARNIEEDGPFMLFVGAMGCLLLGMIALVALKLMYVMFGDSVSLGGGISRRGNRRSPWSQRGPNADPEEHKVLPYNSIYQIPEAMDVVGDRSSHYAKLRKQYDQEVLPLNEERSMEFVSHTYQHKPMPRPMDFHHSDQVVETYDIYDCPFDPPQNYPHEWNLHSQILKDWPVDQVEIPDQIYQGLCVFDYVKDYAKAMNYRNKEQPFVVENDPAVARTVERWHQPGYVEQMVGPSIKHRTEYNTNNHFLYHMPPGGQVGGMRRVSRATQEKIKNLQDNQGRKAKLQNEDVIPENMRMTFADWLHHANVTKVGPNDEHWYYRLIGCGYMGSDGGCDHGSTEALFDELPFFQPKSNLYIGDSEEQKGIHCRFGMKGVIAENHFDGSRNSIALLMGKRRYILGHPSNCDKMALLPMKHPSARHSAVDYTNPDLEQFPEFAKAKSNEVVLQAGQVLYLPTNWFHFIVSLELNMQCNTRSGITDHYMQPIHDCGF